MRISFSFSEIRQLLYDFLNLIFMHRTAKHKEMLARKNKFVGITSAV